MGKLIWFAALILFVIMDVVFIPLYWLARLLDTISQFLYEVIDDGSMSLTKEWLKKGKVVVSSD